MAQCKICPVSELCCSVTVLVLSEALVFALLGYTGLITIFASVGNQPEFFGQSSV